MGLDMCRTCECKNFIWENDQKRTRECFSHERRKRNGHDCTSVNCEIMRVTFSTPVFLLASVADAVKYLCNRKKCDTRARLMKGN